jgi:DNA polymerase epsilon subunit 1
VISYPCSLLNLLIKDHYTNDQYHELIDKEKHQYEIRSENSIFFEIDGPYLAMILPASKEEGKRIKKRYCVFNMDGSIAELKGFEVKRNGELQLIKIFQASVFEAFLKGTTLEECYNHVATIADYWLDMLYSRAKDITDKELFELISERRTMSRMLADYGEQKSTSISTAKRLAEFLGDDVIKDKGLCCRFVIANVPRDAPITERAIPLAIFQSEQSIRNHYLRKWLRVSTVDNLDIREILDWNYYIDRFNSCIQKIITIPAALQNIRNPVIRVPHPDWLHKRLVEKNSLYKQKRITDVFNSIDKQTHTDNNEQQLTITNDIEDIASGQTKSSITISKKTTVKTLKRKRDELNEKTITRQWRIALGPPPSFGQTTSQHIKWLNYQKRKWDIQREQPSMTSDNPQSTTKQKNPTDGKIDTYIRRAAEHLHTRPWQIISYELTDQPGIFKAWCLVEHELVQIKIKVPRIFYVNYRTPFDEQIKQTQRSTGYERAINNCSHKVNRLLPRCSQAYHLYEYRLDENHFRDYYTDIMTDLSNPNIEGVYEMNVPLDFRLLITLGCICSLRKEQYRTNILSNLYQFDELEFLSLSEQTYLQSGTLQCIYLYIHQDHEKLFIGLFIPNNCRVFIGILDSVRENHMPNLNKLLKNECEKRLQRGIDTNLLPINEHQFEVKVDTDIQNIWKRFNKIIANRK